MLPYLLTFPCPACLSNGFISDLWYWCSDFTLCSCDKSALSSPLRANVWMSWSSPRGDVCVCLPFFFFFSSMCLKFESSEQKHWMLHLLCKPLSDFKLLYYILYFLASWSGYRGQKLLYPKSFKTSHWPMWSFTVSAREIYEGLFRSGKPSH